MFLVSLQVTFVNRQKHAAEVTLTLASAQNTHYFKSFYERPYHTVM